MLTIGQVAQRYAISRGTLIYYHEQGLLEPSGRSPSNYRLYSMADIRKLEKILHYRDAGLSLSSIGSLLENEGNRLRCTLHTRLVAIENEIRALRKQQKIILKLLENESSVEHTGVLNKENWIALLTAAGLDEAGMLQWHIEFEHMSPKGHQDFLESLGIDSQEIKTIRAQSQSNRGR